MKAFTKFQQWKVEVSEYRADPGPPSPYGFRGDAHMTLVVDQGVSDPSPVRVGLEAAKMMLRHALTTSWPAWAIRRAVCLAFGCREDCEAEIGPDSGVEHFSCRRCGDSHDVIWY